MLTTQKIVTGFFEVYWNGEKTEWVIFNGSVGMSGLGGNVYGIRNTKTGLSRRVGTLAQCKKSLALTLKNR